MKNKKTNKIKIAILIIFIIINGAFFCVGNIFYNKVCKINFDRSGNEFERFSSTFNKERYEKINKEEVEIPSNFGYKLSATYLINDNLTQNTVVIVHGITGSRWESMKYADIYLDNGFNVLIYDSRYHGSSGGKDISLGYFEKYDLENCVKWVKKRNPYGIIGVHGESMGAATELLYANMNEKDHNVSFFVSDCAFSDLSELMTVKLRDELSAYSMPISKGIIFYSSLVALYKSGFSLYAVSPIKAIEDVKTPMLFIHGAEDKLIPPSMCIELYNAKKVNKYIYIAPNADHAMSYLKNKKEYTAKVVEFLKKINILPFKKYWEELVIP